MKMPPTVDEEGFGDFVFAPIQLPCGRGAAEIDYDCGLNNTTQKMASDVNDDEDWGDFVTPSSHIPSDASFNTFTTFQSNGFSTSLSSSLASIETDCFRLQNGNTTRAATNPQTKISVGLDPQVGFRSLHPSSSLPSALSSIGSYPSKLKNGNSVEPASDLPVHPDLKKAGFQKCRGPLPLSIFGGDDDQEEEKEERNGSGDDLGAGIANGTLNHKKSEIPGNGSHPNLRAGIDEILASLYARSQPIKSDKESNLNSNLNSNILGSQSELGPSLRKDDKRSDGEDDWDFKSATSSESDSKDQDISDPSETKLTSVVLGNQELRIGMDDSSIVENGFGWKAAGARPSGIISVEHEASIANGQMDFSTDTKPPSIIPNAFTPLPPSGSVAVGDENRLIATEVNFFDDEFGDFMDAFPAGRPEHQEDTSTLELNKQPMAVAPSDNGAVQSGKSRDNADLDRLTSNLKNDISSQGSKNSIRDVISKLYDQSKQVATFDYGKRQIEDGPHVTHGCSTTDENGLNLRDEPIIEKPSAQDIMAPQIPFASSDLQIYVDFYTGLKKELCFLVSYLLDSAEKAPDAEQVKENSKFRDVRKVLQDNMDYEEVCPEENQPRKICCNELLEVLHQPMFGVLESEYSLSRRLCLAERDLNMAVELLMEAQLSVKVLTFGKVDDHYTYVNTWTVVLNTCLQGLTHGAYIWRQAVEKNLQNQILSNPQGRRYIHSLGEIYRVAQIMGAAAKVYKLWVLLASRQDQLNFFPLFDECVTLWSSSGLELAFQNLLGAANSGTCDDADVEALHKSIQNAHCTNVVDLFDPALLQQRSLCHLTLLPQEMLPELKMVSWNGESYFVKVANLWANLISQEPPSLPHLQFG